MRLPRSSISAALVSTLLAGALFSSAAAAAGAPPTGVTVRLDPTLPIHPMLQYGAQAEPDKVVRVLVRKSSGQHDSQGILDDAGGGKARGDFSQLNLSSVELKQRDVLKLARDPRVVYVSPDGTVAVQPNQQGQNQSGSRGPSADELRLQQLADGGPGDVLPRVDAPDVSRLLTTYPQGVQAVSAWKNARGSLTGAGVTVAVLDTGVNPFHADLNGKVFPVFVNPDATGYLDQQGHGTHVIGLINGRDRDGEYVGIAPDARVISVKIADDKGQALESDVLRGLVWVFENKDRYNIKVLNMSLGASTPQSFRFSPIDAAVELLWHSGVTVIASSGNHGTDKAATWSAPGNDPFVITVGCLDDNQTIDPADDRICSFSSRGPTQDGVAKPNIVAPGRKVYSTLASPTAQIALDFPDRISADRTHIRLSGTSMSTPVVSGAAALVLQRFPGLRPDQLKWVLDTSAKKYPGQTDQAGELNIAAALELARGPLHSGNQFLNLGPLLRFGAVGASLISNTTAYWDHAYWDHAYWDHAYWDTAYWDTAYWDTAYWDHAYWDHAYWDHAYWDTLGAID